MQVRRTRAWVLRNCDASAWFPLSAFVGQAVFARRILFKITGYIDPATFGGEPKAVYRLVKKEELTGSLLHQTVYVLWPDDGIWYQAVVKKVCGVFLGWLAHFPCVWCDTQHLV